MIFHNPVKSQQPTNQRMLTFEVFVRLPDANEYIPRSRHLCARRVTCLSVITRTVFSHFSSSRKLSVPSVRNVRRHYFKTTYASLDARRETDDASDARKRGVPDCLAVDQSLLGIPKYLRVRARAACHEYQLADRDPVTVGAGLLFEMKIRANDLGQSFYSLFTTMLLGAKQATVAMGISNIENVLFVFILNTGERVAE